jgi:hypothetical protein
LPPDKFGGCADRTRWAVSVNFHRPTLSTTLPVHV